MINGFEKETEELSEYEMEMLLPILVRALPTKVGKAKAVTNKQMVSGMKNLGYKIGNARLRKLVNYIRRKNLVPCLVASSKGYYVADDTEDLARFVESLKQREDAIRAVRISMQTQLQNRVNYNLSFPEKQNNG